MKFASTKSSTAAAAAILLSSTISFVSAALFPVGSHVKQATSSNFKNLLSDAEVAIVLMTAPWCGHCKNLVPAAHEAAASLAPLELPIINLDCDAEENKSLCAKYDVKGFPTIKVFTKDKKAPVDYTGERSAQAMADYAIGRVKSVSKRITSMEEFDSWIDEKAEKGHLMLLTAKPATPSLYKVLTKRFSPRISSGVARIKKETSEIVEALGVAKDSKSASLFYIPPGKDLSEKVLYEGEMKLGAITAWVKSQIGEPLEEPTQKKSTNKSEKKPKKSKKNKESKKSEDAKKVKSAASSAETAATPQAEAEAEATQQDEPKSEKTAKAKEDL